MLSSNSLLALMPLVASVYGATHTVTVGKGGLVFSPDSITAADGDQVVFEYYPGDHSVVQADFSKPCAPMSGGFYSGVINSNGGPATNTFTLTVKGTDPMWFYCGAVSHCQSGMVGVINPPSSGDTLASFKSAASNADETSPPSTVQGGVVGPAGSGSSSSAGAMTGSAMSSAAMTSAAMSTGATTSAAGTTAGAMTTETSMSGSASAMMSASGTTMMAASGTASGSAGASSPSPAAANDLSRGNAVLGLVAAVFAFIL